MKHVKNLSAQRQDCVVTPIDDGLAQHAEANTPPKPFVKWAGGKRQLINKLLPLLPQDMTTYVEPFVGGGALMWEVALRFPHVHIVINDLNEELVNAYRVVRDEPERLLVSLSHHQNDEHYYYSVREMDRQPWFPSLDEISRASRFLYLNKTGYNGLWRVNKKGQCNVPFGRYKTINYADKTNLMACAHVLKRAEILSGDFEKMTAPYIRPGAFFYFDPPYMPVSETASFTSYTESGFGMAEQKRLRDFCLCLDRQGVKFMLSNSDTATIRALYKGFEIMSVSATRAINSRGDKRGKVGEVIVKNY